MELEGGLCQRRVAAVKREINYGHVQLPLTHGEYPPRPLPIKIGILYGSPTAVESRRATLPLVTIGEIE